MEEGTYTRCYCFKAILTKHLYRENSTFAELVKPKMWKYIGSSREILMSSGYLSVLHESMGWMRPFWVTGWGWISVKITTRRSKVFSSTEPMTCLKYAEYDNIQERKDKVLALAMLFTLSFPPHDLGTSQLQALSSSSVHIEACITCFF